MTRTRGRHLSRHSVHEVTGPGLVGAPVDDEALQGFRAIAVMMRHNKRFEPLAERIEAWCQPALEAAGLPTDGTHGFVELAEARGIDPHSVAACAARVRDALDEARVAVRLARERGGGCVDVLFSAALDLGCAMQQAGAMTEFGQTLDGVERRREGASRARRAANADRKPAIARRDAEIREAADDVRSRNSDLSVAAVIRAVRRRVPNCPGDKQMRRILTQR